MAFGGILLGLGLRNPRLSLRQTRLSRFPGSFPAVVLRLGDQGFLVQALSAVPVQFGAVGIRLSTVQVGNCRSQGCLCRNRIGPRSLNRSSSRRHIGRGLHVLQLGKQSPSLDSVAFFYVKLHDLSKGIGADVHIGERLDLARGADHRGEVLFGHLAGLDRDRISGSLGNREGHDGNQHNGDHRTDNDFLFHLV